MKKALFLSSIMIFALCFTACNSNNPEEEGTNGKLVGKFSVSDKLQVYFSQGNLQYQASTKTWQFADKQYKVVGENNEAISATNEGWIDLFIWGFADDPLKNNYEESDFATFTDWGKNKISNGGNKANQWRTLTIDEWAYLYDGRENAEKLRGFASVREVNGYVFLPDNWEGVEDVTFIQNSTDLTDNVYSGPDWKVMEEAGAIFLPCAGVLSGKEYDYYNVFGYYWSANPYEGEVGDAFNFYFYTPSPSVSDNNIAHCTDGYAVRLVKNVK